MSNNIVYIAKSKSMINANKNSCSGLLKPYCLDEMCIPFYVNKNVSKKHIKISNNSDENHNNLVKNNILMDKKSLDKNGFQFKVENILLQDLTDLNNIIDSKSLSVDNSFFSSSKQKMTNKLELSRSKTDSSVYSKNPPVLGRTQTATEQTIRCPIGSQATVNGRELLLLRFGDKVFASDSKCPHKGAPLIDGDIENLTNGDRLLQCSWHRFRFNLDKNGQKEYPLHLLTEMKLQMYKTHVDEHGAIFITFDDFQLIF